MSLFALLLVRFARQRGYFMSKVQLQCGNSPDAESHEVFVLRNLKPSLLKVGVKFVPPAPGVVM